MSEMKASEAKLVQYLNEAYAKEKELEVALQAHIGMTSAKTRKAYNKRLKEHLRETKRHAKELERRIKKLGGRDSLLSAPREALSTGAGKLAAAAKGQMATAKGPLHMLRGTSEEEKLLKNAKTEYWNEHEEIATYTAIETLAEAVGDTETAKLARAIRRDEEKMARYLERLIPQLTKAVARVEIPAAERNTGSSRRSSRSGSTRRGGSASSGRKRSSSSRRSASGSRSRAGSRSRSS